MPSTNFHTTFLPSLLALYFESKPTSETPRYEGTSSVGNERKMRMEYRCKWQVLVYKEHRLWLCIEFASGISKTAMKAAHVLCHPAPSYLLRRKTQILNHPDRSEGIQTASPRGRSIFVHSIIFHSFNYLFVRSCIYSFIYSRAKDL